MTSLSLPNNKYTALVKRELIEHRTSFVFVPIILISLIIVLLSIAMMFGNFNEFGDLKDEVEVSFGTMLSTAMDYDVAHEGAAASMLFTATATLLYLILPFVIFFTLLGSLYEERRDRSFLFWKSMPVSDTEEVISRLIGGTIVPFLTYVAAAILGGLVLIVMASIISLIQGGPISLFWNLWPSIQAFFILIPVPVIMFFWLLPYFGWIMLASAVAPKAPLMFAVLPPAVIIALEGVLLESATVARTLLYQVSPAKGHLMQGGIPIGGRINGDQLESHIVDGSAQITQLMLATLSDPQLYIGIVLGLAFLAAAIWRRRFTS